MTKLILLIFSFYSIYSYSQIKGVIFDENNQAVPYINVLLKANISETIISYTSTSEKGQYYIDIRKIGKYRLLVSGIGYQTKTIPVEIKSLDNPLVFNITISSKAEVLDEIIVESKRPITVKKDTIIFNAEAFTIGNEEVVEDLLKNIPGLDVDSEGTIRVGNREVEKVMVDGDDFFEKGYKILTKNMPSNVIANIEVLERYANNKLLKDIEDSDKVALNLTMKEESKRQWFGNLMLSHSILSEDENRYDVITNLMNFGKKNKYYFLTNFNNVGSDATGNVQHLIHPTDMDETGNIGFDETAYQFINVSNAYPINFKKQRTNFNDAELTSLNAIFNPNKKLKIKTLAFFNWDEIDFFRNSTETFTANQTGFTNTEDYVSNTKSKTYFAKLDVSFDISKTEAIRSVTKHSNINSHHRGNLVFNGLSNIETLDNKQLLFDQKFNYTNRFNRHDVLLFTGRLIVDEEPQKYQVNQFFFKDLFANNLTNNVAQFSENIMTYIGAEAHFLSRKKNNDLLELKAGFTSRNDGLVSHLDLRQNEVIVEQPPEYQNDFAYLTKDFYIISKYIMKFKTVSLIGEINIHHLLNKFQIKSETESENPFFINPSIGFKWEINEKNKLSTNYSVNRTNASILYVYPNYILTGYRSLSKGTGTFNQLDASTLIFNYQLGDWSDKFFANVLVVYNKNHDFFSTDAIITQNYSQTDIIKIEDRDLLNISTNADYYFKWLKSNFKIKLGMSQSNFKNRVNGSDLREITSTNYNYGFESRSALKGIFNYHIGTKWITTTIETTMNNSFTNNVSFLDLSFVVNKKIDFKLQTERYYFGNLQNDKVYYFLDFDSRFHLIQNKLTLGLTGRNLFNTEKFRDFSISDIGTSTTEYRLLPRFILLNLKYRF